MKKFFILFFIVVLTFSVNIMADEEKKEESFKMKVIAALSNDVSFTNNKDAGFWGFVDENAEKQYFGGYMFGMIMALRFSENLELFMDITILRSNLLMGKAGSYLKGIAVWDANPNHSSSISPILDNDIYYISKATMGRVGGRFIYPINDIVEPYIGLAAGLVPFEIGFGNQDGSRAYSDIINEIAVTYALIFGSDFNLIADNKKILTIGLFLEFGGSATEPGTEITNWIWQNWTYHAQFPVIPAYRLGFTLSFNI